MCQVDILPANRDAFTVFGLCSDQWEHRAIPFSDGDRNGHQISKTISNQNIEIAIKRYRPAYPDECFMKVKRIIREMT